jgi:hypothetical protein
MIGARQGRFTEGYKAKRPNSVRYRSRGLAQPTVP